MPRVTKRDQYKHYQELRQIWLEPLSSSFGVLTPNEQWKIHAFYRPSERLTFDEFKAHLRDIKARRPGLVHVAGRLSRQIIAEAERYAALQLESAPVAPSVKGKTQRQRARNIIVQAVVRPEPDLQKLVRVAIELAKLEEKQQPKQADDDGINETSHPTAP